jgi:hypothetical protein
MAMHMWDGIEVLSQCLHLALDNGIGAVTVIHLLLENRDWPDLRARGDAHEGNGRGRGPERRSSRRLLRAQHRVRVHALCAALGHQAPGRCPKAFFAATFLLAVINDS